jgi:uncharacterized protein
MYINVAQLLKSPVGTTREYDFDPGEIVRLDDELDAVIQDGALRLDHVNGGILARGHVTARCTLSCSRCLEPVEYTTQIDFAEQYAPSIDMATGRPLPPPDDDLTFVISQNHILDTSEAVRQYLLAALPIQPLCRPDCAGLCPTCGINHNVASCACTQEEANRPFAALADLLATRPEQS